MTSTRSQSYLGDPAAPEPNAPQRMVVLALLVRDGSLLLERRADQLLGLELPATQRPVFECLLSGEPTPFLL